METRLEIGEDDTQRRLAAVEEASAHLREIHERECGGELAEVELAQVDPTDDGSFGTVVGLQCRKCDVLITTEKELQHGETETPRS